jgi:hypothetical protein
MCARHVEKQLKETWLVRFIELSCIKNPTLRKYTGPTEKIYMYIYGGIIIWERKKRQRAYDTWQRRPSSYHGQVM